MRNRDHEFPGLDNVLRRRVTAVQHHEHLIAIVRRVPRGRHDIRHAFLRRGSDRNNLSAACETVRGAGR